MRFPQCYVCTLQPWVPNTLAQQAMVPRNKAKQALHNCPQSRAKPQAWLSVQEADANAFPRLDSRLPLTGCVGRCRRKGWQSTAPVRSGCLAVTSGSRLPEHCASTYGSRGEPLVRLSVLQGVQVPIVAAHRSRVMFPCLKLPRHPRSCPPTHNYRATSGMMECLPALIR